MGDAVRERVELQNGLNNQFEGGDPFYAAVFTQALRLGGTHAGLRPLVRAPELGKLAGDLIGAMGDYDLVKIGGNMTDIFTAYPAWAAIEPVAAPCPAGSNVIDNPMVVHGAGPNMTTRQRRAMTAVTCRWRGAATG